MNKKEIEQRIDNIPTNKYIYQRYNGLITKYIDNENYYINCETGNATKKDEHLMLGKVSENIIDLIGINDYVNGYKVRGKTKEKIVVDYYCYSKELADGVWLAFDNDMIETILTKEQFEANCYKVGGEYE